MENIISQLRNILLPKYLLLLKYQNKFKILPWLLQIYGSYEISRLLYTWLLRVTYSNLKNYRLFKKIKSESQEV